MPSRRRSRCRTSRPRRGSGRCRAAGPSWQSLRIEPPQLPLRDVVMDVAAFTPRSLAIVTVPPIAGRMFGGGDTAQTCTVVIVNEEAAERSLRRRRRRPIDRGPCGPARRDHRRGRHAQGGPRRRRRIARRSITTRSRPARRWTGSVPARFRVPVRPEPARGVLDANIVSSSYFDAMGLSPMRGQALSGRSRAAAAAGSASSIRKRPSSTSAATPSAAPSSTAPAAAPRSSASCSSALLRTLQRRVEPAIYFPMAQDFSPRMTLILGAREPTDAMLAAVRRRLDGVPGGRTAPGRHRHSTRTSAGPRWRR